jgi:1-acyl-sn-glycerol-3-phosphate acyltransferase
MKRFYLILRSIVLWLISGVHFFVVCSFLVLLAFFIDPRKNDRPQRIFCRNILRLAGAKFDVRCAPGFDPRRTSFFIVNHVNLFDPFVLYAAIPQFVRGLEFESHFRIPAYGWMMKRFGNVPVPSETRPSDLKRMWKLTQAALDQGVSLIVFPEGGRTVTGRVGPFKDGVFRMAQQFGYPLVPVSIVGSFEFNNKLSWLLRPSTIVVHVHDTMETKGLSKEDVPALRDRVHAIISRPVDEWMNRGAERH